MYTSFIDLRIRWGILWRKFRFAYEDWAKTIIVLMKLHNFIMDRRELESAPLFWEDNDQTASVPHVVLGGGGLIDEELMPRPDVSKRQVMTDKLEDLGMRRPAHAHSNSRT